VDWPAVVLLGGVWLPHAVLLWRADVAEHRLPNRLTASFAVWTAAAGAVLGVAGHGLDALAFAVLAAAVAGAIALALALVPPGVLGMGDAKLVPTVAFQCAVPGWDHLLGGLLGTVLAAAVASAWLLGTRRARRGDRVAFGPFLLLAFPASLVLDGIVRDALLV
jgi:leader peptidase (prepilin peptidase) / N-methyltransferase